MAIIPKHVPYCQKNPSRLPEFQSTAAVGSTGSQPSLPFPPRPRPMPPACPVVAHVRRYLPPSRPAPMPPACPVVPHAPGYRRVLPSRQVPPVFVARYPPTHVDEERLAASHAATDLQFHVVLSTWRRRGVFGETAAAATAGCWRRLQSRHAMHVEKVSFVPDHVHRASRWHWRGEGAGSDATQRQLHQPK